LRPGARKGGARRHVLHAPALRSADARTDRRDAARDRDAAHLPALAGRLRRRPQDAGREGAGRRPGEALKPGDRRSATWEMHSARGGRGVARAAGRAIRRVCPRCGRTPLFRSFFSMHEACAVCGLRFERAQGYWVGAIYVNSAVTVTIAVGGYFVLWWLGQ